MASRTNQLVSADDNKTKRLDGSRGVCRSVDIEWQVETVLTVWPDERFLDRRRVEPSRAHV